ncbi:hypothetical protein GCM10020000_79800 [Streptomyces olivoverticillatus]
MANSTDTSVYIAAPLDVVWQLTNDVRTWPDLFTEYASVEVLHEDGPHRPLPAHDGPRR